MPEFKEWPKIQRLDKNTVTITEKIDGTNVCVIIENGEVVGAQSRQRLITPDNDNFGFAGWVDRNKDQLKTLGDGYHYGEWAGPGIQQNPHLLETKTFFLFNSYRWDKVFSENELHPAREVVKVVPTLYVGEFDPFEVNSVLECLSKNTLGIASGKDGAKPEGIIIYFHAFKSYLKRHLEGRKNG